ncbi:deoxyguanosine kinase [Mycoplasmopsis agassizii]|uniref:Deoxyguanosine kinase n=1 Tax=Mycoplasmopsis agassizii TaxID=33922 RepID=A0A269TI02_9BACT|nr:deoxynucleoside kinase [Mycoplasmopsis agassizii]PAK21089.1 deoxyguanosine kinase [Mycoplasmopsis agassizii]
MIIGISGMISAGKSTLVESLKKLYPRSLFLAEFEEEDEIFNTFLKWLYEKKPHLTMSFQTYVVESHSAKFHNILKKFVEEELDPIYDYIFLDRFAIEHYIFAYLNLLPSGEKYLNAYDSLFSKMIFEDEIPDYAIYLDVTYEKFVERIKNRGRDVEIANFNLNESYFQQLHAIYKPKFEELARKYKIPYTIIDTTYLDHQGVLDKTVAILKIISDAKKIQFNKI